MDRATKITVVDGTHGNHGFGFCVTTFESGRKAETKVGRRTALPAWARKATPRNLGYTFCPYGIATEYVRGA